MMASRTRTLSFKVTPEEEEAIRCAVKEKGIPTSSFLHDIVVSRLSEGCIGGVE